MDAIQLNSKSQSTRLLHFTYKYIYKFDLNGGKNKITSNKCLKIHCSFKVKVQLEVSITEDFIWVFSILGTKCDV